MNYTNIFFRNVWNVEMLLEIWLGLELKVLVVIYMLRIPGKLHCPFCMVLVFLFLINIKNFHFHHHYKWIRHQTLDIHIHINIRHQTVYKEDCYFLSSMEKWKFFKSFVDTMKNVCSYLKPQKRLSLLNVMIQSNCLKNMLWDTSQGTLRFYQIRFELR